MIDARILSHLATPEAVDAKRGQQPRVEYIRHAIERQLGRKVGASPARGGDAGALLTFLQTN
jgi:hypothetical protein